MAVDDTVDPGAQRVRLGPAPSDDNRGDGAQRQAVEFVDWDGHGILDMNGPEWNFMVESHRAVARELARASRPHLLRMRWERQGDEVMEFMWDFCQQQDNIEYLYEVSLEASRSRAAHDFKHATGAPDDAVVDRSRRKLETVVFTNMDAIRDQATQAVVGDGWMAQEEGEDMVAERRACFQYVSTRCAITWAWCAKWPTFRSKIRLQSWTTWLRVSYG